MSEGDTRYDVVRAGPKGGWSLMHGHEGITPLYEDTRDLQEVAMFGEPFLALAETVASLLNGLAGHAHATAEEAADCRTCSPSGLPPRLTEDEK